jgi:hypothetical protein
VTNDDLDMSGVLRHPSSDGDQPRAAYPRPPGRVAEVGIHDASPRRWIRRYANLYECTKGSPGSLDRSEPSCSISEVSS